MKKKKTGKTTKSKSKGKLAPKKSKALDIGSILKLYSVGPAEGILLAGMSITGGSSTSSCADACVCMGDGMTVTIYPNC